MTVKQKKSDVDIEQGALLGNLLEYSTQPFAVKYPDGRLGVINRAFEKLTGYTLEELKRNDWYELLTPPEFRAMEQQKLLELERTGKEVTYEKEYIQKDGTRVPIELLVNLMKNEDGTSKYYYAFINNITERKQAEKELNETTVKYSNLLNNTSDGVWIHNLDGKIIKVNDAYCQMSGYTRDELIDKPISEIEATMGPEEIARRIKKGIGKGGHDHFMSQHKRKDGSIFDVDITGIYLGKNEDKIAIFVSDNTERNKAEDQVNRQIALLNGINKVFHEALTSETEEEVAGKCLEVAEELTSSEISFLGEVNENGLLNDIALSPSAWNAFKAPPGKALELLTDMKIVSYWGRTIIEGKSQIVNNPESDPDRSGLPKGHPPINRFLGVPLKQGNKTIGLIALANKKEKYTLEDKENMEAISYAFVEAVMRKRAEKAFHSERDLLQDLINGAKKSHLVYLDRDFNFVRVNETYAKTCGYEPEEMIGKNHFDLYPHEENEAIFAKVRDTGEPVEYHDKPFNFPDQPDRGTTYWDWMLTPIKSHNEVVGLIYSLFETTESKRVELRIQEMLENEQQLTEELIVSNEQLTNTKDSLKKIINKLEISNRELEQFAYVASHDLQEPLRMVGSFTQLLEMRYKNKLDDDADDYIGFIVEGANRMKDLIDDLLAFSRLNTEAKEFELIKIGRSVNEVLSYLKPSIEESKAKITKDPLPSIMGDSSQIRQLLQNLIVNAIKFQNDEPPRIHISAQDTKNEWKIDVSDNGIGIRPEHQKIIFDVFKRLHTREEYPGTGIGLAICKRIVERHGGQIWVESEEGKGSTFYFTIPKT